jgi:hypothetical protein
VPEGEHFVGAATGKQLGVGSDRRWRLSGKPVPLFLIGVLVSAALGILLPHGPNQPSFIGLSLGSGLTVALLSHKPKKSDTPTGWVLLGLTDTELFVRDQGTTATVVVAISRVSTVRLTERNRFLIRTWVLGVEFVDPRPPLRVWISCLSIERKFPAKIRRIGQHLASSSGTQLTG